MVNRVQSVAPPALCSGAVSPTRVLATLAALASTTPSIALKAPGPKPPRARSRPSPPPLPEFLQNGARWGSPHAHIGSEPTFSLDRQQLCEVYPQACAPPFSCGSAANVRRNVFNMQKRIATEDGHANLGAWCANMFSTDYMEYVHQCLAGKVEQAASIVYALQEDLQPDGSSLRADAAYCRAAGHCDDMNVTPNTTLADAEKMCDLKYTHEGWTAITVHDVFHADPKKKQEASVWGKLACAMGNYHCDVVYCKIKHCNTVAV